MIVDRCLYMGSCREIARQATLWGAGVDFTLVSKLAKDMASDTDAVYRAAQNYPKRLVGMSHIISAYGETAISEARQAVRQQHFKGMKLHPTFDAFLPFDESVWQIYDGVVANSRIRINYGQVSCGAGLS